MLNDEEIKTLKWAYSYPLWEDYPAVLGVTIDVSTEGEWQAYIVADNSLDEEDRNMLIHEDGEAFVLVYNSDYALAEKNVPPMQIITADSLEGNQKKLGWVYQKASVAA